MPSKKGVSVLKFLQGYYPFGLTFNSWSDAHPENNYTFNGKEEQEEWGVLDYEWRNYDASLGRFNSIDPHADRYLSISPYNYAFNNPILYVDPDGRDGTLYLQVLTDEDGNVSDEAKQGVLDAINRLVTDFQENGVEASIRISYSNDIISKDEFENSDDYQQGDSYTLIGTANQLNSATKIANKKGWEDLSGEVSNTVDGSSGRREENFSIVNLDNSIDSDGNLVNKPYSLRDWQNFDSVGEKLFHLIRHETGHDKLFRSSDVNTFGGHSTNPDNMLHTRMYNNQNYSKDQVDILRRLHNVVGPKQAEPLFKRGFILQN